MRENRPSGSMSDLLETEHGTERGTGVGRKPPATATPRDRLPLRQTSTLPEIVTLHEQIEEQDT